MWPFRYNIVMKVEIQRTPAQHEIRIFRGDGVTLELRPVGRKFSPPHDVIHFVVEQTLGLQRGVWRTVADGAKFPNTVVIKGRQPPHAEARSKSLIKSNQWYLNEAEVFVGVFQDVLLKNPKAYREIIRRRVKERGREIEPDEIERVWSSLIALRKRWDNLAIGDSIVLEWPDHCKSRSKRP